MRSELVGIRITKEMKAKLDKMAEEDTRSLASMIYKILKDYLAARKVSK